MKKLLLCVFCICVLGSAVKVSAQGNRIYITLQSQNYTCESGELNIRFQLQNVDANGQSSNYATAYSIYLSPTNRYDFTSFNGIEDVEFNAPYTPGYQVIIAAQGTINNSASYIEYSFNPTVSGGNLPPRPSITGPAMPVCSGSSVTLNAAGSSGYEWSDGRTGDNISVSSSGTYRVRATNGCGASDWSDQFDVVMGTVPSAPVIGSSNGTLLCNGQSTTFSATSSGGTTNWSNGSTGTSFVTTSPGTYYATESNFCGTSGNSNVIVITTGNTPPAPFVSSSGGTELCNGATTTLSTWTNAAGSISWNTGATGNSISVSTAGSYYAVESNGCGTSSTSNVVTITTGGAPSPPSISSSNGTLLCNGTSTTLTASGSGSITWNTGATGNSITVNGPGTYYAVASNSCGTSSASNIITIGSNVTPGAPSVASSGGTLLCNGASTVLSTLPAYGGTIYWSTGAVGNATTVSSAGNYYAYEINGCAQGGNSNVITISTANTPAAPTVSPSGNQLLCNGASITLSSSGSNVVWNTGATGNTITVSTPGSFYTYDRNACGNSANSNVVNTTTVVCPTPLPGSSFFVCPGALKTLDAGAGYDSYSWSNGATTRMISVGPGTYTVTVSKQGCFAISAPVTVGYYSVTTPTISVSGSTTFCAGGSVTLTSTPGSAYAWNNGATTNPVTVASSGSYYVTVTDGNGCQATSAAVNVLARALPSASISGNTSVCQNGTSPSITFSGSGGVAPYTFLYRINGGSVQTVTSSGSSVTISVPIGTAGDYIYSLVSVSESSSTACSNTAIGSATVRVLALPVASITGSTTVCRNATSPVLTFTASGGNPPYTFTYRVNGGANQTVVASTGNSATVSVPTNTAGTFIYSLVSVQEGGSNLCANSASGSATIVVNPLPEADITGTTAVCAGGTNPAIKFSGSGGTAPYTFSYRINGGSVQTITTVSGNSVTINAPTTTAGTYTYSLVSVQESSSTACTNNATGSVTITVNPLPTATIAGTTAVCKNSAFPLISFTGNGGVAPYTFQYRVNGGAVQNISTASGSTSISVPVPTFTEGAFTYSLVSVQESSGTACSNAASGNATITINPLPTATISGSATVCQNGASPVITFTGNGGTAPYTFFYRIGSGAMQNITTVSGNTATISVPSNTSGSTTYTLLSVQDASSTACTNAASGAVTIVVNPQPAKALITTLNTHLCNGETGIIKITNYVNGQSYNWFKNGVLLRVTTTDTLQVTEAGTYTVLAVTSLGCAAADVSETIIITTGTVVTPVITGSLKVCEGGKTLLAAQGIFERWRWWRPPGNTLSEDSSFFAEAGQYRVSVMNQGCADSTDVTVTADDTEFPAGELRADPLTIAYGESVHFIADVTGAAGYHWDFGNGRQINTASNTVNESYFISSDSIPVKVWATSQRNCTTLFTTFVSVGPMHEKKLVDHSFTGKVKDWNLFPLPFHDVLKLTVILARAENVKLDLFTTDGKWIRSWTYKGIKGENLFTISNTSDLIPGVLYFITGYYNNQQHTDKIYKY